MSASLKNIIQRALAQVFAFPDAVKAATYVRPTSFSSATGQTALAETSVAVNVLLGQIPLLPLAAVGLQLGDDKAFIRAGELSGISQPGPGDYFVESISGQRRDVLLARLELTSELWIFHTRPSPHEDWGDLTAATTFEDRGDLAIDTASEDYLTLN